MLKQLEIQRDDAYRNSKLLRKSEIEIKVNYSFFDFAICILCW